MAILAGHVRWFEEIFARPGVLREPIIMLGFQEIGIHPVCFREVATSPLLRFRKSVVRRMRGLPEIANPEFRVPSLIDFLRNRGLRDVRVIDPHDPRSDFRHDMNQLIPRTAWASCNTFLDIGSLEHVFDTRTCLENALRMVRVGGFYLLHTCVNGYLGHGLHTFNDEGLLDALELNGFRVEYLRFTTPEGEPVETPGSARDTLAWILARKERELVDFRCPEQRGWDELYREREPSRPTPSQERLERVKSWVVWMLPPAVLDAYRLLGGHRRSSVVARGIGGDRRGAERV